MGVRMLEESILFLGNAVYETSDVYKRLTYDTATRSRHTPHVGKELTLVS